MSEKLPVHGFVLAGGKSSRMGTDKALLEFRGRALVEIAVEKLRGFCAEVSIAGNREDLCAFAPVVREERVDCGPAAGIEAGLRASQQDWVMFVPVDVPLVPRKLLRDWADSVISVQKLRPDGSYLRVHGKEEPGFCLLRKDCRELWSNSLNHGERHLSMLMHLVGAHGMNAKKLVKREDVRGQLRLGSWFTNVNTPRDLAGAEAWAETLGQNGVG